MSLFFFCLGNLIVNVFYANFYQCLGLTCKLFWYHIINYIAMVFIKLLPAFSSKPQSMYSDEPSSICRIVASVVVHGYNCGVVQRATGSSLAGHY